MLKPICIPCQRFFRMHRGGVAFIEGMPTAAKVPPGTAQPQNWKPYKLWSGDVWRCHGCGQEIISGTGLHPIAEHYQDDFNDKVTRHNASFRVNDC